MGKHEIEIKLGKSIIRGEEAQIIAAAVQRAFRNEPPKKIRMTVVGHRIIRVEEVERKINLEKVISSALSAIRSSKLTKKQKINTIASCLNNRRKNLHQ